MGQDDGHEQYVKLIDKHRDYSQCMRTMYKWKLKYPENDQDQSFFGRVKQLFLGPIAQHTQQPHQTPRYVKEFMKHMDAKHTKEEVKKVFDCVNLTETYWMMVAHYGTKYTLQSSQKGNFRGRHSRFLDLVKPLHEGLCPNDDKHSGGDGIDVYTNFFTMHFF